jgi:ligand-binding sensor domain-containing protein
MKQVLRKREYYHILSKLMHAIISRYQYLRLPLAWAALQIWILCAPKATQGQLYYDYYNSQNGLSQNSVYSITQTNDGFMWFGTQEGINRFDGKYFTKVLENYNKQDVNEMDYGEFSKLINVLFHDSNDWLWVGTAKEISIYNRYKNKFFKPGFIYKNFAIPLDANIVQITELNRQIWVLTLNKGLFCYDLNYKKMMDVKCENPISKKIIAIQKDIHGNLWFCDSKEVYQQINGTFIAQKKINQAIGNSGIANMTIINKDLWIINGNRKILLFQIGPNEIGPVKYFSKEFQGKASISDANTMHQSSKDIMWIGSRSGGLLKINLQNHQYESLTDNTDRPTLNTKFVLSFYTDKQNITWVGLSGGVLKFDHKDTKIELWKSQANDQKIATDNNILSIYSQNDKDFYMGTMTGGLLYLNWDSKEYQYYLPTNIGSKLSESKNIYEIIGGENNLIWMATWGGLYSFNTLTKQFFEYKDFDDEQTLLLCSIIKLKQSNKILLGGYNGGLRLFNIDTKRFEKIPDKVPFLDSIKLRVRYMKEFEGGNIFMSTETNCLVQYNYLQGTFTTYPQFNNLCGTSRYFYFDSLFLWIATDDGLIQADKKNMRVIKYWTTKNGLSNNYIYTVLPDSFRRIWVSSNAGISMIDYQNNVCRNFTLSDNLQDLEFNTACCYTDKKNNLWFGGINGLNIVQPTITRTNTFSPKPMMTQIEVMNLPYKTDTAIPYIGKIVLPYDKNFINFQFQTPNYSQTDKIVYKYLLKGVDTGWIYIGNKNFINYTQLQPGTYTFMVKSNNANNQWSQDAASVVVEIIPPWWRTWWFWTVFILVSVVLLLYVITYRIRRIKKEESLKYKIIESEMKSLRSQMNPHFIFNSLNSINGFVIENKTHLASDYLTKFARLIRLILENSKNETITLEKELDTLKLYLLMESLRFEDKFEYHIQIEEGIELEEIFIPPLIIQPFVENAIWHGLLHRTSKGKLEINIFQKSNQLSIEVIDDGIGREKSATYKNIKHESRKSYGIEITKQRILSLNKQNTIEIIDLKNGLEPIGTKVQITLFLF